MTNPVVWVRGIHARPEYVGLLRVLVDHADLDGMVSVRLHELTSALDLTESPVKKMLAHLAALGVFERESTAGPHGRQVLRLALETDPNELGAKIQDAPTHRKHAANANRGHTATVYTTPATPETIAIRPRFAVSGPVTEPTKIHSRTATVSANSVNAASANNGPTAMVSSRADLANQGHTATVLVAGVSPTPPSELTSSEDSIRTSSTSVDEGNTPKGIPTARARSAKKKFDRGELKPVDDEVRARMIDRWSGPLGGPDEVTEQIQLALAHEAVERYTDIPAYVNNWLRRRASETATRHVRNGSARPTPTPATTDEYAEFARFNRSGPTQAAQP